MLLVVYMWLCFLITANGQSTEKADLETLELVHVVSESNLLQCEI